MFFFYIYSVGDLVVCVGGNCCFVCGSWVFVCVLVRIRVEKYDLLIVGF